MNPLGWVSGAAVSRGHGALRFKVFRDALLFSLHDWLRICCMGGGLPRF